MKNKIDFPDQVRLVMQDLISGIVKIKVGMVRGVYITGSISLNDFQPGKSDIDFVILCDELPPEHLHKELKKLHKKIERRFKTKLNGNFIYLEVLRIYYPKLTMILSYHEGRLIVTNFEMAPVILYELQTTAIRMGGKELKSLPIQINLKDVREFLSRNINNYWHNWCDKHSSIFKSKILLILFPRLTEWVILGLARQLYTLHSGKICSKTEAGYYCIEYMPKKYHPVIYEAIQIRKKNRKHLLALKGSYYIQPSVKRCNETLDCAYAIIDVFNNEYERLYKSDG